MPFLNYDPQQSGPQYLEDLATGYWFSEALFTAVELGLFPLLEPEGKRRDEIAASLDCHPQSLERFLHALCALGLLYRNNGRYYNTPLSREHLIPGKPLYQGASIIWRKTLGVYWDDLRRCLKAGGRVRFSPEEEEPALRAQRIRKYLDAMDCIARSKAREIVPLFSPALAGGELLDVGAGSGALAAGFLEDVPALRATLMDIPDVLEHAAALMRERGLEGRTTFLPANILEPWPLDARRFDLVILSNIIHAYSEEELPHILEQAARSLKDEGILVIHDFFLEHFPGKAALSDLNMFINTYNGKVFSLRTVQEELRSRSLALLDPVRLPSDTALLIAAKSEAALSPLAVDKEARLVSKLHALGFSKVRPVAAAGIRVTDWADLRCRFGCTRYGSPHCPPNSPAPEKTRELLKDYTRAVLLEGEPPTREFQRAVVKAEREAFIMGYHKAFAFWAGPCSLCSPCAPHGVCLNTKESRPSMEGAGIDVFETVRSAGLSLRTLGSGDDFVKYYALLLVE